jgi:cytochrome b involved in lipid metabolism
VDSKWSDVQWTVYRGKAYDLTAFLKSHPGGNWLINLALKVCDPLLPRVVVPQPA